MPDPSGVRLLGVKANLVKAVQVTPVHSLGRQRPPFWLMRTRSADVIIHAWSVR